MISHENILKFLGQSERRDNLSSLGSEYWLATEYHPKGSLYDYLKANLVSWENLCKIALSIGKGLGMVSYKIVITTILVTSILCKKLTAFLCFQKMIDKV